MKIFHIRNGFCHWDATKVHPTLESTVGRYTPNIVFVEAPDYVFEGWGFDASASGDARFIQPVAPDGWLYDPETGTFYPENPPEAVEPEPTEMERLRADVDYIAIMTGVEL